MALRSTSMMRMRWEITRSWRGFRLLRILVAALGLEEEHTRIMAEIISSISHPCYLE